MGSLFIPWITQYHAINVQGMDNPFSVICFHSANLYVPRAGVEPALHKETVFKTVAAANYAIWAFFFLLNILRYFVSVQGGI